MWSTGWGMLHRLAEIVATHVSYTWFMDVYGKGNFVNIWEWKEQKATRNHTGLVSGNGMSSVLFEFVCPSIRPSITVRVCVYVYIIITIYYNYNCSTVNKICLKYIIWIHMAILILCSAHKTQVWDLRREFCTLHKHLAETLGSRDILWQSLKYTQWTHFVSRIGFAWFLESNALPACVAQAAFDHAAGGRRSSCVQCRKVREWSHCSMWLSHVIAQFGLISLWCTGNVIAIDS